MQDQSMRSAAAFRGPPSPNQPFAVHRSQSVNYFIPRCWRASASMINHSN